ncbi:type I polyketide synthase [Citreimonas salinaria]|uniref:Acyl transferase domain-containing protein n=1 Tax=Citreimonas salinaria TaxID=321339 RepID=A0A1H3KBP6_9RHOB|nr:type I polyketide synthase [Citreimonas salinaria]SDY49632.1 Acyl transferase domain-containing protein [Citreimonas salinaria]
MRQPPPDARIAREGESISAAHDGDIAIVGMAAHLPGAADIESYWRNLVEGRSAIARLDEDALRAAGEDPARLGDPAYVPFAAPLDGFDEVDAEFLGLSPKEAAIMDPQHRRFLETAWEAMENAGHVPDGFDGRIGVWGGCGMGSYFYFNLCSNPNLVDGTGMFLLRHTGNDKDFLTTRVSHAFDLTGPSVNLQTACSTSLVAVHYAAQALLTGECDMALAGGVTIELPQGRGYLYRENEVLSPDGACHAYDHRAQGTVFGSGAGVVVLRRLADALADGDHVWAVLKGSAVNNDGAQKAGYLAPSVEGQARAVAEALALAGVPAETIDYVEGHGTGTRLGDPLEVAALSQAFRETSAAVGHCRIGSVKTNIGHLDTAAGVAGLIKTALALHHAKIPPSLGFERPNPAIAFDGSPFRVADALTDWPRGNHPRRAGINSLGVGGTNAFAVLEEAPARAAAAESDWPFQVLTVSGRNRAALEDNAVRLAAHLRAHPEQDLADVAFTLQRGRRAFDRRMVVVAGTHDEAARLLEGGDPRRLHQHRALESPDVAFLFPGGGAQYAGMARDLYETEPVFAEWMDRGLDHLATLTDADIRALWLPEPGAEDAADKALQRPSLQLPLIMIVEYALAQMWRGWGIEPTVLAGHSMGENAAACVAGVIGFEDCIGLVHLRGMLFDTVEPGGMLSVALPATELRARLGEALDLASENAPGVSVASGPQAALDALAARLAEDGVEYRRIGIDVAAHSRMLDGILDRFGAYLRGIALHPPRIPLVSNRTGRMMTDGQATDPDYWVGHLRNTVLFADCIETLARENRVFLEVGPGGALTGLARQNPRVSANQALPSLRRPDDVVADDRHLLEVLGRLAALGVAIDWVQIWGQGRARVPLPTYAFQRQRYFIEPGREVAAPARPALVREDDVSRWGWRPVWRPQPLAVDLDPEGRALEDAREPQTWLLFADEAGLADAAAAQLRAEGHRVTLVYPGDRFGARGDGSFVLAPEQGRGEYDRLLQALAERDLLPDRIGHFWLVTEGEGHRPGSSFFHRVQEQGFYALLFLAQAMGERGGMTPHVVVVTSDAARLGEAPLRHPAKATLAGPARVIPREFPGVSVTTLDVDLPAAARRGRAAEKAARARGLEAVLRGVLEELRAAPGNRVAALRDGQRYEWAMRRVALDAAGQAPGRGDVVLITGGLGGVGLTLARDFAARGAHLVLVSREALPPHEAWDAVLRRGGGTARRIRAVRELEAAGAQVMVAAGDVCNAPRMAQIRSEAEARFGRITGVIHAAGVMRDAPILGKSLSAVEDVFTPKVHGTQVLGAVFPDGAVDWMVLFSSSSTITAPAGQVDYVAANAFLDAYAQSRAGGATRVVAIDWGIWSEVGMAAEAVARGVEAEPVALPLLGSAGVDARGDRVFDARLSTDDWVVDEHRTRAGDALLPGAACVTLAAHALAAQGEDGPFEIRDLDLLRPLRVPDGGARAMRTRLRRAGGGYDMDVLADFSVDGRAGRARIAQAGLSPAAFPRPAPLDLDAIRARLGAPRGGGGRMASAQTPLLDFGPRWQVLHSVALGEGEGLAALSLAPEARDDGCLVHPALLDIATGWAMELIEGWEPTNLWAPVRYGRVRVHGALPSRVLSWVRNAGDNRAEAETVSFDIVLAGPDGAVVIEIEGFTIRRLASPDVLRNVPEPTAPEMEYDDADAPRSPAEERLARMARLGIRPAEGAQAFRRALDSGLGQVAVSALDLDALLAEAERAPEGAQAAGGFERPQLDSDYEPPETEIEKTLAGFWSDLLGIAEIGVRDSFFDLGGHSLISVRLFALIRRTYAVDFPISVLFEAPTIRACAALIEARTGASAPAEVEGPTATVSALSARRFAHVVPMHEGDGGARRPFFLVAGMFGNVLNLRHLATLLGADRPVYGLQARGLYGEDPPHETIQEAAADYIAEMRQVQPHGPYLVGGFSGGGITAFEIAQQLRDAGEDVPVVVMLDTPLPRRRPLLWRDRAVIQWHKARAAGPLYPLTWARNRIAWEFTRRRATAATEDGDSFHNAEIEAAFYRAVAVYRPQAWDGWVALFRPPLEGAWRVTGGRAVRSDRTYALHDNDWSIHATDLAVHEVPGDHDSMVLEPNVRVLAAMIRDVLRRAEGDASAYRVEAAE